VSTRRKKIKDNLTLYRKASRIATLETLHGKHFSSYEAGGVLLGSSITNQKEGDEERNHRWWDYGYQNWNEAQFKKGVKVTRVTFHHPSSIDPSFFET